MAKQCRPSKHTWKRIRGGAEVCTTCKTRFPCRHPCRHIDCLERKGQPLPDWIREVQR